MVHKIEHNPNQEPCPTDSEAPHVDYASEFDEYLLECEAKAIAMKKVCRLPASGFTHTLNEVYDWANAVAKSAKAAMHHQPVKVSIWAYREQNAEWLSVDFYTDDQSDGDYIMTFLIGEPHSFDLQQPTAPDMTEALHMAGILCDALDAHISLGRRNNEVNRYCTPDPWSPNQTNGKLRIKPVTNKLPFSDEPPL